MVRTVKADDRLMGPAAVAEYVGVPVTTVYGWNTRGTGPRRFRVGKHVRYRLSDVDSWLERHAEDGAQPA